jgi:hypothetical protein
LKSSNSIPTNSKPKEDYKDIWNCNYLIDKIFNDLIENGYDNHAKKQNTYIDQIADKFRFFRLKSYNTYFDIYIQDLDKETILQIESYTSSCKTSNEKYLKLNGIFAEVIARITKQAEPLILSQEFNGDVTWLKSSLNEIRETISFKWKIVSK